MNTPVRLSFTWKDYFKALLSWVFAFRFSFSIKPGLYYLGAACDNSTPLLVTCNYHMTVFLLWRILKKLSVRLLVIDTLGINVWCSSGKGRFSADEILKQTTRYDHTMLSQNGSITLVLPKLSLSGVSLAALKRAGIRPIIGPVYARELPAYLAEKPLHDCDRDKYRFSLSDRLFTLVPSLVQTMIYACGIFVVLFVFHLIFQTGIHWQVFPFFAFITIFYIILFPVLPTKTFAIKGLALYGIQAILLVLYYFLLNGGETDLLTLLFYLAFLAGANLFYSLYYTGNSGVSNYSLVRKEIMTFLPLTTLCFLGALALLIVKGVAS